MVSKGFKRLRACQLEASSCNIMVFRGVKRLQPCQLEASLHNIMVLGCSGHRFIRRCHFMVLGCLRGRPRLRPKASFPKIEYHGLQLPKGFHNPPAAVAIEHRTGHSGHAMAILWSPVAQKLHTILLQLRQLNLGQATQGMLRQYYGLQFRKGCQT